MKKTLPASPARIALNAAQTLCALREALREAGATVEAEWAHSAACVAFHLERTVLADPPDAA